MLKPPLVENVLGKGLREAGQESKRNRHLDAMFAAVHAGIMLIYKILTGPQWSELEATRTFQGAPIDLADGYIHFSTAAQMRETAAKHFGGQDDLHLAWCEAETFGEALKWEVSRGGDKFPHLYATLSMDDIAGDAPMPLVDGMHQFPEGT